MSLEITLSSLKTAKINEFKGRRLLDIRNYYEKDGEMRPTQKGVSLTAEQWQVLLQNQKKISRALGIPEYGESGGEEEHAPSQPSKRKKREPKKKVEVEAPNKAARVKSEEFVDPADDVDLQQRSSQVKEEQE